MSTAINRGHRRYLGAAAVTLAAAILGTTGWLGRQIARGAVRLPFQVQIPSLGGTTAWLNSPPLTPADLRGKVVLGDFWTSTL
jgi:hypothetical protein